MNRLMWVSFFSISCCALLWSETTLNTEHVREMVVFLHPANADGSVDKDHPLGTGFLIVAPVKNVPMTMNADGTITGAAFLFLITARHIVDPSWANCSASQPSRIYIRVNKKNYDPNRDSTGVDFFPVNLVENGEKKYLVRNDDASVDAAVVNITGQGFLQDKYDFKPMGISSFASSEEITKLEIGDSIASAGLIPKRSGEKRNYPFFKFGQISSIPNETVWVGCPEERRPNPELMSERVWFIAVNLVGGNSGSPVLYYPPEICGVGGFIHCTRGLNRVMIMGVQSSSFDGADVAGMTPIEDVFKIIEKNFSAQLDLYRGDDKRPQPTTTPAPPAQSEKK